MDEEENVRPDVMFIIDVVLKTLENSEESCESIVSVIIVKRSILPIYHSANNSYSIEIFWHTNTYPLFFKKYKPRSK